MQRLIWITSELQTPGAYSYNATIADESLKVWLHLRSTGFDGKYHIISSAEKVGNMRGQLGKRQREQARTLRAELEPLFVQKIRAAGWRETTDRFGFVIWTR